MKHLLPKINPGEILCDRCNGIGGIGKEITGKSKFPKIICKKCLGEGKLDWIEFIKGGKETLDAEIDYYIEANENRLVNFIRRTIEYILKTNKDEEIQNKKINFYLQELVLEKHITHWGLNHTKGTNNLEVCIFNDYYGFNCIVNCEVKG